MTSTNGETNPYIDNGSLTDDAVLTGETLKVAVFSVTPERELSGDLNLKDKDQFRYYSKSLRVHYPGCDPVTSISIPDCIVHHEVFPHFGKAGIYFGVPQSFVNAVNPALQRLGVNCLWEDTGLASTNKYWWNKVGKDPAKANEEYLFMLVEQEDAEGPYLGEQPYPSFESAITRFGNKSLIVNAICGITMTGRVARTEPSVPKDTQYRARVSISSATIVDITDDVPKPESSFRGGGTRLGVSRGDKQRPRGNLVKMMGQLKTS